MIFVELRGHRMKQKILYGIYLCETVFAIIYYAWIAPHVLAVKHLDNEVSYPILLLMALGLCWGITSLVSKITKKEFVFWRKVLTSLTIWGVALLFIGFMSDCPACSQPI